MQAVKLTYQMIFDNIIKKFTYRMSGVLNE